MPLQVPVHFPQYPSLYRLVRVKRGHRKPTATVSLPTSQGVLHMLGHPPLLSLIPQHIQERSIVLIGDRDLALLLSLPLDNWVKAAIAFADLLHLPEQVLANHVGNFIE